MWQYMPFRTGIGELKTKSFGVSCVKKWLHSRLRVWSPLPLGFSLPSLICPLPANGDGVLGSLCLIIIFFQTSLMVNVG